jgi:hypothetical protein
MRHHRHNARKQRFGANLLRAHDQRTGPVDSRLLGMAAKSARRILDDGSEEDVPLDVVQGGTCHRALRHAAL